jgi:tetratricopeptide (TPR) repeat protein/predicted Ser/Thr protein kinase
MTVQGPTHDWELPLADRRRIDAACDRFEDAWRAGEPPDLASFLAGTPDPAQARLFRELLILDLEYRRRGGATTLDAEGYRARFPEFATVIDAAFTLDGPEVSRSREREATAPTLRRPSGDDATLPGKGPAPTGPQGDVDTVEALREAGYEVVGELGRGGMGVVYRAYQASLNRTVAVKVIRAFGFASEAARRRFQNEAEAVAQLDHPHIVPVYETGRGRGLDYFSMRLVPGASLDRRIGEYAADSRAAARLVAVVAEAIHHAHQRGILHRDLKPANILVDDRGAPHVTDFGLAHPVEPGGGDLTHSGALVGTPSYMAPEQTKGVKGALTTATDVYGLGGILYALLTGRAPHAGSSLVETLDMVRDTPPEPPSKQNPHVPRDLEVICLKCLEKDPRRRYADAQAMADDLARWLDGRPIAARPVGPATRARMWCRRHPLPAALAALLVLSVVAGFAAVTAQWRTAVRERNKAAKMVDFLTNRVLAESSTEVHPLGDRFTVVEMLDRAAARIGGDFHDEPGVEAAIRETIGGSYLSLGEYAKAEPHLRAALKLDGELYGPEHRATLHVNSMLTALLAESGRDGEAEPMLRRHLEACRRALGPEDPATLDAANQLGALLRKLRRLGEAEPMLRQALDARRRVLPVDHPDTLRSVRELCLLQADRGRLVEADALAHEYEHGIRCARGPKHPDNVPALANRGLIRLLQGKPDQAEPFYRQAAEEARRILGPEHPRTLAAASDHARVLRDLGRDPNPPSPPP